MLKVAIVVTIAILGIQKFTKKKVIYDVVPTPVCLGATVPPKEETKSQTFTCTVYYH